MSSTGLISFFHMCLILSLKYWFCQHFLGEAYCIHPCGIQKPEETDNRLYGRICIRVEREKENLRGICSRKEAVIAVSRFWRKQRSSSDAGSWRVSFPVRKPAEKEQLSELLFFLFGLIACDAIGNFSSGLVVAGPAIYFDPFAFFQVFVVGKEMFNL